MDEIQSTLSEAMKLDSEAVKQALQKIAEQKVDANTKVIDVQKEKEDIEKSIEVNVNDTEKEAIVSIKENPAKNEPPMQVDGNISLKSSEPKQKTIKVMHEENGQMIERTLTMNRMTVAVRESVMMLFVNMFLKLDCLNEENGFDTEKLIDELDLEKLSFMANCMRGIAHFVTDANEAFFQDVPASDAMLIFIWITKEEVGLIKSLEDFFSTAGKGGEAQPNT